MLRRYQQQLEALGWTLEAWDHGLHYVWYGWAEGKQWIAYLAPAARHPGPEETWRVTDWLVRVRPDAAGTHEDVEIPHEHVVLRMLLTTLAVAVVGGIVYDFYDQRS